MVLNQRVTKKHLTLHTYVQGATDAHNQQYDDGRSDTRQSDVPDLLQTACTVHISGLVKTRINTCHGRQINNCVPANLFPAVDQDDGYPDERCVGAHQMQVSAEDTVNNTTVVEDVLCNTCDDNPGYEVRQIGNGLRYFFELREEHLVQKNRKCDCCDRSNRDVKEAYSQCVD